MTFREVYSEQHRPASVRGIALPRRERYYPSASDWRNEVFYFLLVDRFSDGKESTRQQLNRSGLSAARPPGFRFDKWAQSGGERWQGGTIAGVRSKLDYLKDLGITSVWLGGPVLKQRAHLNTYHGYAVQDFLEVDPRFGSRAELIDLVQVAHAKGLRIIFDIVINHTGCNWIYANGQYQPPYRPFPEFYDKGQWLGRNGDLVPALPPEADDDTGVWPSELQRDEYYTRAGTGDLGEGAFDDPHAQFRRTDFLDLRDFNFDGTDLLNDLARCYKYWIALTDCDGFRIDTLKHVSEEVARNFCGSIKEYAEDLGKDDFFLVGEVAGSDDDAARYREVLKRNLNATLDIGPIRRTLEDVAKGLVAPAAYLNFSSRGLRDLGSHSRSGRHHMLIMDDHDCISGHKVRFSSDASSDVQVVAGVALQLFSVGIPCIYYGTEQSFSGPEKQLRDQFLPDYDAGNPPPDKYLREAMFGPEHPLCDGTAGFVAGAPVLDQALPGFGPFGTSGYHCFDDHSPAYTRIATLVSVRQRCPVLRVGRQYARQISNFQKPFDFPAAGELIAWSRLLDEEEALCIVNGHGTDRRGGDVVVDAKLNGGAGATMQVIANSEQAAATDYRGTHPVGEKLPVKMRDGTSYVEIRGVGPSEVLILSNYA